MSTFRKGKLSDRKLESASITVNDHWWEELTAEYQTLTKEEYIELDPANFTSMNAFKLRHLIQGTLTHAKNWHDLKTPTPSVRQTRDGKVIIFHTRRVKVTRV